MIAAEFFEGTADMNRIGLVVLGGALALTANSLAQHSGWPPSADHLTINVWPGAAPGAPANPPAEADTTTAKDNLIAGKPLVRLGNVSVPTLTLYKAKNASGLLAVFGTGPYVITRQETIDVYTPGEVAVWTSDGPRKPLVAWDSEARILGLIMPVPA